MKTVPRFQVAAAREHATTTADVALDEDLRALDGCGYPTLNCLAPEDIESIIVGSREMSASERSHLAECAGCATLLQLARPDLENVDAAYRKIFSVANQVRVNGQASLELKQSRIQSILMRIRLQIAVAAVLLFGSAMGYVLSIAMRDTNSFTNPSAIQTSVAGDLRLTPSPGDLEATMLSSDWNASSSLFLREGRRPIEPVLNVKLFSPPTSLAIALLDDTGRDEPTVFVGDGPVTREWSRIAAEYRSMAQQPQFQPADRARFMLRAAMIDGSAMGLTVGGGSASTTSVTGTSAGNNWFSE
jgi:hypothetical protein